MSRRHALITTDDSGSVTIRDLNSADGTFVNDVRLEGPRVLQRGDLLRFANLVVLFEPARTSPPGAPSLRDSPTRPLPVSASAKTVPLSVVKPPMPASPPDAAGADTGAADVGAADAEAAQPSPALAVTMPLAPTLRPAAAAGPAVTDLAPVLGTGELRADRGPGRSRDHHAGRCPAGRRSRRHHDAGAGRCGAAHRVACRPGPAVIGRERQCGDHRRRVRQHPRDRQGPAGVRHRRGASPGRGGRDHHAVRGRGHVPRAGPADDRSER